MSDILNVVDFAWQVIDMSQLIKRQKLELEELRGYKQKYFDLLNADIAHSQVMIGGILQIAMTPGVMEAIGDNNKAKEAA